MREGTCIYLEEEEEEMSGHIHIQCVPEGAAAGAAESMGPGMRCSGREGMVLRSTCFGRMLGRRQPCTWLSNLVTFQPADINKLQFMSR